LLSILNLTGIQEGIR